MVSLGQEKFREGKEIGPNLDFCVGLEWEERKSYEALVSTTSFPIHNSFWGFPGGSVVKKICSQCRRRRFNPWSGKIGRAAEQLSLCADTTEPVL